MIEMNEIGSVDQCRSRSINDQCELDAKNNGRTNSKNDQHHKMENQMESNAKIEQLDNNSSIDNEPNFSKQNNIINNELREERTVICDRCYLSKRTKPLSIFTGK
jgi:hypothetical protein